MPDREQSFKVISRGGLNSSQNFLELTQLDPGFAVELENFETSLTGGYRRINGFTLYDLNFGEVTSATAPAEGAVLGVFGFINSSTNTLEVIAARKQVGSNTYRYYKHVPTVGWQEITTGITHNSLGVLRIRSETFNFGDKNVIIFVDGVNKAVIYDGTNWYELSSSNTGGSASPGGNQVLDAPSIVTSFKNHIFLSGDPNAPAVVAHSAPKDYLTWTVASGAGQLVSEFPVVQIKPFRDDLFIFGSTAIKKAVPDVTAGFLVNDVTKNLGCISRDSIFELAGNLVFLSNDGLRIVAGTAKIGDVDLSIISDKIRNTLVNIENNYNLEDLKSLVIRNKTQFRYFIGDGLIPVEESIGIVGSLRVYNGEGLTWEFGKLKGIRTSCVWSGYDEDVTELVLHGDYDGNVYRQEVGNSFNGTPITAIYTTPYYDFGDTEMRKTMRKINIFTRAEGSFNIQITVGVSYDFDNLDVINPADYQSLVSGKVYLYDSGVDYDSGAKYSGTSQPVLRQNIQGSGRAVQFSFITNDETAPFTIQGFVIELTPQGRQ